MGKEELNTKTPVAPVDMTNDLCCPLLGIIRQ
jgi:carboxymethylenebutenolidase